MFQARFNRIAIIGITLKALHGYNYPFFHRSANRYFAAKLILFMGFAFGNTTYVRLMNGVVLVLVAPFLLYYILEKQQIRSIVLL